MSRRIHRHLRFGLLAAACGIALVGPAPLLAAQDTAPAKQPAAADRTYVMLIRLRGDLLTRLQETLQETGQWQADEADDQALAAHEKYWAKLRDHGRAILAGGMGGDYWDNVALIVFTAPTLEAARTLVRNDPAVRAYVFQAQVRPFDLHWLRAPGAAR